MYDNLTASSSDSMFSFSFPYNGYGYDGYVHPQQPSHSQASAQVLSGPQPQELAGLEDLLNPTFQYADPTVWNNEFVDFNTPLGLGNMDIGVEGWNDVPAAPAAAIMDEASRAWQAQERMLQELMGPLTTGGPCSIDFGFDMELSASEPPATSPSRPSSAGSAAASSSSRVSSSSGESSASRRPENPFDIT
ncbi:hypothetical protein C8Q74DRAFT_1368163 [Fomes fomentarius]|nr:hypothetical protein C8Q74DRAFT_1368163 [Fomes fomentarius]